MLLLPPSLPPVGRSVPVPTDALRPFRRRPGYREYEDSPGADVVEYTEAAQLPPVATVPSLLRLAAECERSGLRRTVRVLLVLPLFVRPGRVRSSSKETSREGGMQGTLDCPGLVLR